MKFEEWLDKVEVYSTRRERLIEDLITYRDDYNCVIKWLEAAYNEGVRDATEKLQAPNPYLIPPYSPTWPPQPPTTMTPNRCSRCGLSLSGVMGFVCGDTQCPSFAHVTCVSYGLKTDDEGYNG